MQLAIVGGTRFIGHAIAEAAVWRGHEVAVFHRGEHASALTNVKEFFVDRNDPSALCHLLGKFAPDAVIDTRARCRAR